jgi:beta-glucuronidase
MKYTWLLFLMCMPLCMHATPSRIAEIQPGEPLIAAVHNRKTQSLHGKWHYIVDPYQNGYFDYRRLPHDDRPNPGSGAYFTDTKPSSKSDRIEYSFDRSPTIIIPGAWGTQVNELTWYEGTVWFKRDFLLDKEPGQRYFLHFGAVNYEAHVWLNGKKLGTHVGGFTPFNFEVTDALVDGSNFVVVMADTSATKTVCRR